MARVPGTDGYAEAADSLLAQYESISFADAHRSVLHLIPRKPVRVLDIGAGTGRDAGALAAMGHRVVAVEPTDALRRRAAALHVSPVIEWVDDGLPDLPVMAARDKVFDLVMLTAVWMHLDRSERGRAMPNVARLVRPGGLIIMSLRYGPVPAGRRMFTVAAEETVQLAATEELRPVFQAHNRPSAFGGTDVTWTWLAFAHGDKTGTRR